MGDRHVTPRVSTRRVAFLRAVVLVLALVSLVLPLAPSVGDRAFTLLIYHRASFPPDFSTEAVGYIRLTNAVLGAVMAGWFMTMFVLLSRVGLTRGVWSALVVGLAVWFVPDTAYSLASGYWENAVLNGTILATFVPGLGRCPAFTQSG